ncbi:hypothetical protein STRPS_0620 [Streptococcus pseudoporcinus LQ 940-04]|uniref:Uncharacterized protein n=1 Tax=Streptococcus pseudoporcinus LQ 940-04 TaxID=875093 RepID=G5K978_9STRE|nr:hypothetical protein STRPS_0620 [Streptococcus pseudoporcinus LQ 940-04]
MSYSVLKGLCLLRDNYFILPTISAFVNNFFFYFGLVGILVALLATLLV